MLPPGVDQRAVMQAMLDKGISTRRGVMNAHLEPAYMASGTARIGTRLGHSEIARDHSIMLPLFAQMGEEDVARVADALGAAMASVRLMEPA